MKTLKLISFFAIIICLLTISVSLAANPSVQINGEIIDFTDDAGNKVEAQIINDRTMVPLRKIFEVLNCKIDWNGETKTVVAKKDTKVITLQIGNKEATTEDTSTKLKETITLDSEPIIIDGRTLVPFRFIGESLGMEVAWDKNNYTAIIIDYDSIANVVKQKCEFVYNYGLGNSITIEKKYFDEADATNNYTTKLSINSIDKNGDTTINVTIDGDSTFAKEAQTEEWNSFSYEIDGMGGVITSNYAVSKMLGINKNEKTLFDYTKVVLSKESNLSLGSWIKSVSNVSNINKDTYGKLKNEWTKFANTFLGGKEVSLSYADFEYEMIDFDKVFTQRYKNATFDSLLLLNSVLFKYSSNLNDLVSDYPDIKYSQSTNASSMKVNVILKNEYKEKIEYTFNFQK